MRAGWRQIFFLCSITLLFSCTTTHKSERSKDTTLQGAGVSLERDILKRESSPKVDSQKAGEGAFGPLPVLKDDESFADSPNPTSLLPVVALTLSPGMMRALVHTNVFKALKYEGLQVHIVSGTGMGAVFASMYAFGLSPDLIEWRVFNFLNKVEGLTIFSSEWREAVYEILLKDIANKRLEQANITLLIPVLDPDTDSVVLLSRGELKEAITSQFNWTSQSDENFLSPMLSEVYGAKRFRKFGADIIVGSNALGENFKFNSGDGFMSGVMGRVAGFIKKERTDLDFEIVLPVDEVSLDGGIELDNVLEKSYPDILDQASRLKKKMSEKKQKVRLPIDSLNKKNEWFDQSFFIREND